MNKTQAEAVYGYFRMVLGMTRKLVEQIPADKLGFRPTPESRSAAEVVSHMYTFLVDAMETIARRQSVTSTDPTFTDRAVLVAYMDEQVSKAFQRFGGFSDEDLAAEVEAYGSKFSGSQFLTFAYDEHWHHRGQLTVYLRLLGVKPLMIYGYESLNQQA